MPTWAGTLVVCAEFLMRTTMGLYEWSNGMAFYGVRDS